MRPETETRGEKIQLYSPRFQNRKRNIIRIIKRIFGTNKSLNILDAGCGEGNFMRVLEEIGYEVEGIDVDAKSVQRARESVNGSICLGDLASFPFAKKYDLIVCGEVLEHIPEDIQALLNMRAALRPGGAYYYCSQ